MDDNVSGLIMFSVIAGALFPPIMLVASLVPIRHAGTWTMGTYVLLVLALAQGFIETPNTSFWEYAGYMVFSGVLMGASAIVIAILTCTVGGRLSTFVADRLCFASGYLSLRRYVVFTVAYILLSISASGL